MQPVMIPCLDPDRPLNAEELADEAWERRRARVLCDIYNTDGTPFEGDPRYILDLLKRVIRVSIETVRIVKTLPPLPCT